MDKIRNLNIYFFFYLQFYIFSFFVQHCKLTTYLQYYFVEWQLYFGYSLLLVFVAAFAPRFVVLLRAPAQRGKNANEKPRLNENGIQTDKREVRREHNVVISANFFFLLHTHTHMYIKMWGKSIRKKSTNRAEYVCLYV